MGFRSQRWSPYVVGLCLGILSWVTIYFMDERLGASTSFVRLSGLLIGLFNPDFVQRNAYYAKYLVGSPVFEWQFALLVGVLCGSCLSVRLSASHRIEWVPALWRQRFGPSKLKRLAGAFVGGILLALGARMAGGCTSGHGISGGLQLALSGWVFMGTLFAVGIPAALLIYRR